MRDNRRHINCFPDNSRRLFLQGLAVGGVMLGMSPLAKQSWAAQSSNSANSSAPILSGKEFNLVIEETAVNFTGKPRMATTN